MNNCDLEEIEHQLNQKLAALPKDGWKCSGYGWSYLQWHQQGFTFITDDDCVGYGGARSFEYREDRFRVTYENARMCADMANEHFREWNAQREQERCERLAKALVQKERGPWWQRVWYSISRRGA